MTVEGWMISGFAPAGITIEALPRNQPVTLDPPGLVLDRIFA